MKKSMVFEGVVTILLIVLLFLFYVMVTTGNTRDYNWQVASGGPVSNIYFCENGSLYAFMGAPDNTIYSIDNNGTVLWKYQAPGQWGVINKLGHGDPYKDVLSPYINEPVFATSNGTLYLYIRQIGENPPLEERLLAISRDGNTLWDVLLGNYSEPYSDVRVSVENGSIYAYSDYKVTVLNESGSVLFNVDHVSDPPAVDENGNMYLSISTTGNGNWAYQQPLGTIESYNPVGSVLWVKKIDRTPIRPDVAENMRPRYGSLPAYQGGLLYLPVQNGIMVLYTNGSVKWSREYDLDFYSLFSVMPFDASGNVYLSRISDTGQSLTIIDKNGNDTVKDEHVNLDRYYSTACGDPYNGRIYYYGSINYNGPTGMDNLLTYNIAAYDLLNGKKLWSYSIPAEKTTNIIIHADNLGMLGLLDGGAGSHIILHNNSSYHKDIGSLQELEILPAKDGIYLSFYTINYQLPLDPGRSECLYSSAIYALSEDGALQWSKPTDSFATSMAANNSTIYYGTRGGKVVSAQMNGVVGGIALIAIAYVFFRFFIIGAAARARDRLDKNENRNRIFDYIAGSPGLTVNEISRGTGVNLGTVRYHMLILSLNHKVVAGKADDKYVRYFTNSNSYSKGEQLILSLMRREAVGKILGLMLKRPGISNIEMAKELGIQESVVCRSIKELSEKGVVTRDAGGCSVEESHKEHVAAAIRRIQGE